MWTFYVVAMVAICIATVLLIRRYAAPTVSWLVIPVVAIAWATAMSVVALVPLDIWTNQELLINGAPVPKALTTLWSISYWTTQVLTWLAVPIMMGFADAGDFTMLGRLRTSLGENLRYWMIIGSLGLTGFVYLLLTGQLNFPEIWNTAIVFSNTYGLIAITLLLGYGLVEIPRNVWRRSFPEVRLKWHHYRVGKAAERLEVVSNELRRLLQVVQATSGPIPRRDVLRPYMDVIIKAVEQYSPILIDSVPVDLERLNDSDLDYGLDVSGLAALRRRVMRTINSFLAARTEYVHYVKRAFNLEAVCQARATRDFTPPSGGRSAWNRVSWWYKCVLKPWVQRLTAVSLALLSAAIVWSEATIGSGTSPDLSPFSLVLHSMPPREFATQFLVALPLGYMCLCAYYSLFKLGMFHYLGNIYHLVQKSSGGMSMLRSGSLLCRFAAPLCFNFLHVLRLVEKHSVQTEVDPNATIFVQKMASAMVDVPFLGRDFNSWFPLTMVGYTFILVFEVWDNCLTRACTKFARFFAPEQADAEHTERGRLLVRLEQDSLMRGGQIGECLKLFGNSAGAGPSLQLGSVRDGQGDGIWGPGSKGSLGPAPPPVRHSRGASSGGASAALHPAGNTLGTAAAAAATPAQGLLKGLRGVFGRAAGGPNEGASIAKSAAAQTLANMGADVRAALAGKYRGTGGANLQERAPLIGGAVPSGRGGRGTSGGGGMAAGGSAGRLEGLDAIFARIGTTRGGTAGRIDDDDDF